MKRYWPFFCVVLFLVIAFVWTEENFSPTFRQCVNDWAENHANSQPDKKSLIIAESIGGHSLCLIKAVDHHNGFFASFAAFIIAWFAFTLYHATKGLLEAAQVQSADMKRSIAVAENAADAAQKSVDHIPTVERAYIFVTPIPAIEDGKTVTGLMVENFGQTPGIITEVYGASSESEPTGQPLYPPRNANPRLLDAVLGKGSKNQSLNRWWSAIIEPHFFFGYIRYTDIFRKSHTTKFCVKIFPADGRIDRAGPDVWNSWN
ncbi:MAG: hypothetical protein KGL35_29410 [Bradyrhizobium sp.]|nr:hypothetical protein [Bradyrhizobium sp.]